MSSESAAADSARAAAAGPPAQCLTAALVNPAKSSLDRRLTRVADDDAMRRPVEASMVVWIRKGQRNADTSLGGCEGRALTSFLFCFLALGCARALATSVPRSALALVRGLPGLHATPQMGANQKNKRHKAGRRAGKSAREKHADAKGEGVDVCGEMCGVCAEENGAQSVRRPPPRHVG